MENRFKKKGVLCWIFNLLIFSYLNIVNVFHPISIHEGYTSV